MQAMSPKPAKSAPTSSPQMRRYCMRRRRWAGESTSGTTARVWPTNAKGGPAQSSGLEPRITTWSSSTGRGSCGGSAPPAAATSGPRGIRGRPSIRRRGPPPQGHREGVPKACGGPGADKLPMTLGDQVRCPITRVGRMRPAISLRGYDSMMWAPGRGLEWLACMEEVPDVT